MHTHNTNPPKNALIATTEQEHRLYRLQAEWRTANTDGQLALASLICWHPEWGLAIGPDGPTLRIAPQPH